MLYPNNKAIQVFDNNYLLYGDDPTAHTATLDLNNDDDLAYALSDYYTTHTETQMQADFPPDFDWHWFIPIVGPFIFDYQALKGILNDNPDIKQTVKDILNKVLALPGTIINTGTTLVNMIPWIIGGVIVFAMVFLFKNPGTVKGLR